MKKVFPYIAIVFCAFLTSYSIRSFINHSGLLTSGVSGICLVISRFFAILYYNTNLNDLLANAKQMDLVNTLTSVLFFIINIPLVYLAFKKIGKRFATLSSIYIIANTLFIKFLPNSILDIFSLNANDTLSHALFAGVFSGVATSLALNIGGSTAGLEIIGTYFSRKKQISIGKILMFVNTIIIITGGIFLKEWTPILYTLVLVFVNGRVVDSLHRATRKMIITVISEEYKEISEQVSTKTNYSCTIGKVLGGYTGKDKYNIMIVVPENKVDLIIDIVHKIDEHAFITSSDTNNVYGNFYIEPLK